LASAELLDYYQRRAREYEAIYAKPERQVDLAFMREHFASRLAGRRVIEVACGTGYWTVLVARSAASIVAVDAAQEPMRIAMSKDYGERNVRFELADAYALPAELGRFNAALACFWWSHILWIFEKYDPAHDNIPDLLRNEDWHYAIFTTDKKLRPGQNHAECLGCHKPLDKVSYTFTLKELAGVK